MDAKYEFKGTDNLEATLTVTMRLHEWKQLRGQLETAYPSWKLSSMIRDMVTKAEGIVESVHEVAP